MCVRRVRVWTCPGSVVGASAEPTSLAPAAVSSTQPAKAAGGCRPVLWRVRPTVSGGARSKALGADENNAFPIFDWHRAVLAAHQRGEINSRAVVVGLAVSTFGNNKTTESFPSVASIADRVGAAVHGKDCRSVRYALDALRRVGLIEARSRGFKKSNLYRLRLPETGTDMSAVAGTDMPTVAGTDMPTVAGTDMPAVAGADMPAVAGADMPANLPTLTPPIELTTSTSVGTSPGRAGETNDDPLDRCDEPQGAFENRFKAFVAAFPFDATSSLIAIRKVFADLSIEDGMKAIRFAKVYAADLKAKGRTHHELAVKWITRRAFDDLEQMADARVPTPGGAAPGDLVFVSVNSSLWPALVDRNRREKGRAPPNEMSGKRGWSFPKDWVDMAEAAFQVSRQ